MTIAAFHEAARFPGAIARVSYPIDIHNPKGEYVLQALPQCTWYEIPYGCIVPQKCANLLWGCRAIFVDRAIHASIRIMPVV